MNKKIGDKHLKKETLEEMKGFEEIFDDYAKSEAAKMQERRDRESVKSQEFYELQTFLEKESDRLTVIENFFTKKVTLRTEFSQTEKLILQQTERKVLVKEKLTKVLLRHESFMQKNLAQILDSHFS